MTKRECRRVAQKIADLERMVHTTADPDEKRKAQDKIMKICGSFTDIVDMMQVDEEVQEILKNS